MAALARRELSIDAVRYWLSELDFTTQTQLESEWCWAATASSVSHFYRSWGPWRQCDVAQVELAPLLYCDDPVPDSCNVAWYGVGPALEGVHRGLTLALAHAEQLGGAAEVHLLRVPPIYVDALWLHDETDPSRDEFLPTFAPGVLDEFRWYAAREFLTTLGDAGRRRGTTEAGNGS